MATPFDPPVWPLIHVLIVEQHLTFRDALATRLQAEPDLAVVAKAHSAKFAPRVLVGRSADVILLDAELPDDSALAFCSEMTRNGDQSRVIMLSAVSQPERIVAAVRAGAAAWVRKDESIDHLLDVIHGVVQGDTWIPPRELGAVLRVLIEDQDKRRDSDDLLASLTRRERDVLFLLVEGAGRKEIAARLRLSENTVRTHLHSLMVKFGVHSTLEVVALARPRLEAFPQIRLINRWPGDWLLLTRIHSLCQRGLLPEGSPADRSTWPKTRESRLRCPRRRIRGSGSPASSALRSIRPSALASDAPAARAATTRLPCAEAAQSRWRLDFLRRMRVFADIYAGQNDPEPALRCGGGGSVESARCCGWGHEGSGISEAGGWWRKHGRKRLEQPVRTQGRVLGLDEFVAARAVS